MGRDLSYAYIEECLVTKYNKNELQDKLLKYNKEDDIDKILELDWEEEYKYRNRVKYMWRRLFDFDELKSYAKECLKENNFSELEPISKILMNMYDSKFVVITSA